MCLAVNQNGSGCTRAFSGNLNTSSNPCLLISVDLCPATVTNGTDPAPKRQSAVNRRRLRGPICLPFRVFAAGLTGPVGHIEPVEPDYLDPFQQASHVCQNVLQVQRLQQSLLKSPFFK